MDALPYVDSLLKEYLLFRGFTRTLDAFNADLVEDRSCGFQAERITDYVFRQLIPELRTHDVMEFLEFLSARFYSRLDLHFEAAVRKMEASIVRLLLVSAFRAARPDKLQEFFSCYGDGLLAGPDAASWRSWFALMYVKQPQQDPAFQVFFTADWAEALATSFRNFIAEVLRQLPLPALLLFNTDRITRLKLQHQVEALQLEVDRLQRALQSMGECDLSLPAVQLCQAQALQQLQVHYAAPRQAASTQAGSKTSSTAAAPAPCPTPDASHQPAGRHRRDPSLFDWHMEQDPGTPSRSRGARTVPCMISVAEAAFSTDDSDTQQRQMQSSASMDIVHSGGHSRPDSVTGSPKAVFFLNPDAKLLNIDAATVAKAHACCAEPAHAGLASSSMLHHPAQPLGLALSPSAAGTGVFGSGSGNGNSSGDGGGSRGSSSSSRQADAAASQSVHGDDAGAKRALDSCSSVPVASAPSSSTGLQHLFDISMQQQRSPHGGRITAMIFSPTGENIASGSEDGTVAIWSPDGLAGNPARHALLNVGSCVTALAWDTRADKVMLVGTEGSGLRAWHVDTKRMMADIPADVGYPDVVALACSPQEPTFISSTTDLHAPSPVSARGKLSQWNMRSFKRTLLYSVPGDELVMFVSYSAAGRVFVAGTTSGKVHVYEAGSKAAPVYTWHVPSYIDIPLPMLGSDSSLRAYTWAVVQELDGHMLVLTVSGSLLQEWVLGDAVVCARTTDLARCFEQAASAASALTRSFCNIKMAPGGGYAAICTAAGDVAVADARDMQVQLLNLQHTCAVAGLKFPLDWHPQHLAFLIAAGDGVSLISLSKL